MERARERALREARAGAVNKRPARLASAPQAPRAHLEEVVLGREHLRLARKVAVAHHARDRVAHVLVVALLVGRAEDEEDETDGRRLDALLALRDLAEVDRALEPHEDGRLLIQEGHSARQHVARLVARFSELGELRRVQLAAARSLHHRLLGKRDLAARRERRRLDGGRHRAGRADPACRLLRAVPAVGRVVALGERHARGCARARAVLRRDEVDELGVCAGAVARAGELGLARAEQLVHQLALPPLRRVLVLRLHDLHGLVAVLVVERARRDHVLDDRRRDEVERGVGGAVGGDLEVDHDRPARDQFAQQQKVVELDRREVRAPKLHLAVLGLCDRLLQAVAPVGKLAPLDLVVDGDLAQCVHLDEDRLHRLPDVRRRPDVRDGEARRLRARRRGAVRLGRLPLEEVGLEGVAGKERGGAVAAVSGGAHHQHRGQRIARRRAQLHRALFVLDHLADPKEPPARVDRALGEELVVEDALDGRARGDAATEHAVDLLVHVADRRVVARVADDHHRRVVGGSHHLLERARARGRAIAPVHRRAPLAGGNVRGLAALAVEQARVVFALWVRKTARTSEPHPPRRLERLSRPPEYG
jgi:hypothetical protein